MKKLIPLLCALALFLCGCGSEKSPTALTLTPQAIPETGEQAVEYLRDNLKYAIKEDNYTALTCLSMIYEPLNENSYCEFSLKDTAFIRALLKKLKDAKISSTEWYDCTVTGDTANITINLEYESGSLYLCSIDVEEPVMKIVYSEETAYECSFRDPEFAKELQRMIEQQCEKEGIGLVRHPYFQEEGER